jgi:hypothetical protein
MINMEIVIVIAPLKGYAHVGGKEGVKVYEILTKMPSPSCLM